MSLGQIVRGDALNSEMTPVGVRDAEEVAVVPFELSDVDSVLSSGGLSDGQQSGRSSEHPINGTWIMLPFSKRIAVYIGIVHVPVSMAWPVYGVVGSIIDELDVVLVG